MSNRIILPPPTLLVPEQPEAERPEDFAQAVTGTPGTAFIYNAATAQLLSVALNNVPVVGGPLAASTLGSGSTVSSTVSGTVSGLTCPCPPMPFTVTFTYEGREVQGSIANNLPAGSDLIICCFLNGCVVESPRGAVVQFTFSS